MKVILTHKVEKLGDVGEVVDVARGYARNYLLPHDLALPATQANLAVVEKHRKRLDVVTAKEQAEAEELAARLAGLSCRISRKAGESDVLYGSVTPSDIAEVLEKEGFSLDRRRIILEEPIKTLGMFEVSIRLHAKVTPTIKVWVVKE
jgi:large subunit ribosomal protein L9